MATASTTGVTGNSYLNSLTGTKANKSAEDPENRFLTLLVNQMKNQDRNKLYVKLMLWAVTVGL